MGLENPGSPCEGFILQPPAPRMLATTMAVDRSPIRIGKTSFSNLRQLSTDADNQCQKRRPSCNRWPNYRTRAVAGQPTLIQGGKPSPRTLKNDPSCCFRRSFMKASCALVLALL